MDRLAFSGVDVARKLNLSPSAVSKLLVRGRKDSLAKEMAIDLLDLGELKEGN